MIKENKLLKDFKLPSTNGKIFHLKKDLKQNLIIYVYPKDNTPGCTTESIEFAKDYKKFKEMFLEKNILTIKLMNTLLEKTHQLQCIVNRELVFDATAKVAFMLNQDLDMFNKLKRQEVSFMLHIQPETLSRVLKRLTRSGTIEVVNGDVSITNQEALVSVFKGVGL